MSEKQVVKTTDEIASMFLGLVIVGALVMTGLLSGMTTTAHPTSKL